ncbi:hypothetical protein DL93DRAFT_2155046 [Clavulina sp. PMI_390]|nr:hypothetical protein DL93DRAFT_2155046 [Clavulina sp. PMI_390]
MFGLNLPTLWRPSKTTVKPFSNPFPYDVLCIIVSWVAMNDHDDLKNLALANQQFFDLTSGWIWARASLIVEPNKPFAKKDKLLNALLRRAAEGMGAKELIIRMNADIPEGPPLIDFRARLQRLFIEASQLRSLSLTDTSEEMEIGSLLTSGIRSYRFQLSELSYHISLTPELCSFLASQPSIRHLILHPPSGYLDTPHLEHLPPDSLPHLDVVFANPAFLPILLKGRSVRYVAAVPVIGVEWVTLLWDAIGQADKPPSSLTVALDSAVTFRAFMEGIVSHLPGLRFLGVACARNFWAEWRPQPTTADLAPLRRLKNLEVVRWSGRFFSGNAGFPAFHLLPSEWHPSSYAGPALRYVQHEMEYHAIVQDPKEQEGYWERPDLERDEWEVRTTKFYVPRMDSWSTEGLLDPLGLQYMKMEYGIARSTARHQGIQNDVASFPPKFTRIEHE